MSDRKNDFALMQTDRGMCERALQEAWERDHEDERPMIQRYDDDHLPHSDGCWVMHKDHERDLAALQRRVERAIVHTYDIIGKRVDLEQTRAELGRLIEILEGKSNG